MTGRRQVSLDAADATRTAIALASIETWLRRAPEEIIASLAGSVYGAPTARALDWARDLVSDLRSWSAVLSCAIRAADNPDDAERNPF